MAAGHMKDSAEAQRRARLDDHLFVRKPERATTVSLEKRARCRPYAARHNHRLIDDAQSFNRISEGRVLMAVLQLSANHGRSANFPELREVTWLIAQRYRRRQRRMLGKYA